MAARRGKTQARRNQGNTSGLPGWAWMIIGIVLAVIVIFMAPKYLKSDGDGFFRPQPNPDAQPAAVTVGDDDTVVSDEQPASSKSTDAANDKKGPEYDFYTLLPGKEVPLTDAELAATQRAEALRLEQQLYQQQQQKMVADMSARVGVPLPPAVPESGSAATTPSSGVPTTASTPAAATPAATAAATASTASTPSDNTRYLLQAGAFQASGQAEELKAKIALLGLGARVESAQISGKTVYRVRMGPYGTASDLADAKRKLASGGLPAMAIKMK